MPFNSFQEILKAASIIFVESFVTIIVVIIIMINLLVTIKFEEVTTTTSFVASLIIAS